MIFVWNDQLVNATGFNRLTNWDRRLEFNHVTLQKHDIYLMLLF